MTLGAASHCAREVVETLCASCHAAAKGGSPGNR